MMSLASGKHLHEWSLIY